jgi:hypothetical protein
MFLLPNARSLNAPLEDNPQNRCALWVQQFLGPKEVFFFSNRFPGSLPNSWQKGSGSKLVSWEISPDWQIDTVTAIGGMCSIFSGDEAEIRAKNFRNIAEFREWIRTWYPRIDQVHDAVGVPPKGTKQVLYVCEDSLFGRKVARWSGLDPIAVGEEIREIHEERGRVIIQRWLEQGGYKGQVKVVYTSDVEPALDVGLRYWERLSGICFQAKERDRAKVQLMYTPFWADILGLQEPIVIYEPILHHGVAWDWKKEVREWEIRNPYARAGFCEQMGFAGYMPFTTAAGVSRTLPMSQVPHFGNYRDFQIQAADTWWYGLNFFPSNVMNRSTQNLLSPEETQKRVAWDLRAIFEGEK